MTALIKQAVPKTGLIAFISFIISGACDKKIHEKYIRLNCFRNKIVVCLLKPCGCIL
jgi:hypothetical protein